MILVGVFVGLVSVLFLWLLDWVIELWWVNGWLVFWLLVVGVVVGGFYYWLGWLVEGGNNFLLD